MVRGQPVGYREEFMADTELEALRGRTYPDSLAEQIEALETDADVVRFKASRERLAGDPYRPLYHLSPPEGAMNDPNGFCQWRGRYHLFYQFVPEGQKRWHWGHFVSDDLVHWRDLPPAIYPDKEVNCYSGQSLVEADRVVAMYHGTESGNSIATAGDPLLLNWKKHPGNPVIPIVPVDENQYPYRVFDPAIWKEEDGYYSISGVFKDGQKGAGGDCRSAIHLFRSQDLASWERLGTLLEDGFYTEPGEDGAVPNFWPIGNGKHMLLLFSHKRGGQYYVGDYDRTTHRFTPDYHGRANYSTYILGNLHAPSATIDDNGRFLAFFNVNEGKVGNGWRDIMTMPRWYSLNADNSLRMAPAPELAALRFDERSVKGTDIPANGEVLLDGVAGKAIEIEAVIDPQLAREVGLCVLRSPDGGEQTRISLLPGKRQMPATSVLSVDVSQASLNSDVFGRPPEIGPFRLAEGEKLHLRVFVDRTIVEVFANGRQCLTSRVYPGREDSVGVSLFARGAAAKLESLKAWQMRSIWPELKNREGK